MRKNAKTDKIQEPIKIKMPSYCSAIHLSFKLLKL